MLREQLKDAKAAAATAAAASSNAQPHATGATVPASPATGSRLVAPPTSLVPSLPLKQPEQQVGWQG